MIGQVLAAPTTAENSPSPPTPSKYQNTFNPINNRTISAQSNNSSELIQIDYHAYDQKPRRRFSIEEYARNPVQPQITKEEARKLAKQELIALTLKAKQKQEEIQRTTDKLADEEKERRMFGKFQKVSQPRNRQLWNVGTHVLIQKDGSGQWFHGTIVKIHENYSSEEVLNILYYEFKGNTKYKTVRRDDECVKAPNEDAWEVFDMEEREKTLYEHIFKGKDVPSKLMEEVMHRSRNHSRIGTAVSNILGTNVDGNQEIFDQGIDYTIEIEQINDGLKYAADDGSVENDDDDDDGRRKKSKKRKKKKKKKKRK